MSGKDKVIVYGTELSPPCRTVYMVAEALGINIEKREVSLANSDQFKIEYLEINPLHSIPALDNNGTILVDSHAISTYLIDKYGNNSNLYPKRLEIRSQINSKLYYDIGHAFNVLKIAVAPYSSPQHRGPLNDFQIQKINNIYNLTNIFLENKDWLVGDNVTVADISLYSTVTSLNILMPLDSNQYANVSKWLKNFELLPYAKANKSGLDIFQSIWNEFTKSN